MEVFGLDELSQRRQESGGASLEFLRSEAMSCTIYELPAGAPDPQQPHNEDEVYVVMRGRAKFRADDEEQAVGPGSFIFVEAHVAHRFFDIEEDLTLFVVLRRRRPSRALAARLGTSGTAPGAGRSAAT